jgi:hypothetical protein
VMNKGSPPTARNARTGEFTPPGIMLSARSCNFRDFSVLRDVVDAIDPFRRQKQGSQHFIASSKWQANTIAAHRVFELIRYSRFCNHLATSRQYLQLIKLPF